MSFFVDLLTNRRGMIPLDTLPSILIDAIVQKMRPSAAIRMYLANKRGMLTVSRFHKKTILHFRRIHDEKLWIGCRCVRKALLMYKILCELSKDGIMLHLKERFEWMDTREVSRIVREFFRRDSATSIEDYLGNDNEAFVAGPTTEQDECMLEQLQFTQLHLVHWNCLYSNREEVLCRRCELLQEEMEKRNCLLVLFERIEPAFVRRRRRSIQIRINGLRRRVVRRRREREEEERLG